MATDKTKGMIQAAAQKSKERQAEVLSIIDEMERAGNKVNFYAVAKRSGASKSYLYGNKIISERIRVARINGNSAGCSDKSEEVKMKALVLENKSLKNKIKQLTEYKDKYEALRQEVANLKEQLSKAYTVW